jgi:hypothetical protein
MHGCAGSMMKIPRVRHIITGQGYTKNVEKSSKNGPAKWRRMKRLLTFNTIKCIIIFGENIYR